MKFLNINFKRLFRDDRFLWFFSLLCAVTLWFVVINAIDPTATTTIRQVPVTVDVTDSALGKLGLDNIQEAVQKVDVTISGQRYIIGGVKPEDIQVKAVLTGITKPGLSTLNLIATPKNGKEFDIQSISPDTVTVQFDRMVTKTLPVQVDVSGVSFPEGYIMEEEYVSPSEVIVTGPEAEMSQVYKCVAKAEINRTLDRTEVITSRLELYDADGVLIESPFITTDATTVDITVPVLKIKNVPLTVQFLNVPDDFPLNELKYTLSEETVAIAGPADLIQLMEDINLGYIDMRDLDTDGSYTFNIVLPSGYVNVDGVTTVEVSFMNEEITSRYFNVTDIRLINRPTNFDITVSTRTISNVRVFGPADVLEKMVGTDIVAEIDLSDREIRAGQTKVTVNMQIPSKGLVWANGIYQAQIVVR